MKIHLLFYFFICINSFLPEIKKCRDCKNFIPTSNKDKLVDIIFGKIIFHKNHINMLFGKCKKFKNKKSKKNFVSSNSDNNFVIECRFNDSLCGLNGKQYEKK